MKEFDAEELAQFDGKEDRPVYIAHQGKVYDVSGSKLWKGGSHMRRHHAGKDLTTDISAAPHGVEVFERYPQIGVLSRKKEEALERAMPEFLAKLLKRHPFLRRHPHPMTVHFPIVFMLMVPVFTLLYLFTGVPSLETTALHLLAAGLFFLPVVILTGLFSWWLNYMAKPHRAIIIKLTLSIVMFVIALIAFTWRMAVPDILHPFSAAGAVYLLLILSFIPLVGVIGWHGAMLTFPIEAE